MSEGQRSRPMANLLSVARDGSATVVMSPEDFIYIDRDCEYFKDTIRKIQIIMQAVSRQSGWGLGENNTEMVSAGTVVNRFKLKANGAGDGNSVWQIMDEHLRVVEDIQEAHRIARERMMQADSAFAAKFTELDETLPQREPEGRSPEQALAALAQMPGVGTLFASVPMADAPTLWPGIPVNGTDQ